MVTVWRRILVPGGPSWTFLCRDDAADHNARHPFEVCTFTPFHKSQDFCSPQQLPIEDRSLAFFQWGREEGRQPAKGETSWRTASRLGVGDQLEIITPRIQKQPQCVGELHVLHRTSHTHLSSSWVCKGLWEGGSLSPSMGPGALHEDISSAWCRCTGWASVLWSQSISKSGSWRMWLHHGGATEDVQGPLASPLEPSSAFPLSDVTFGLSYFSSSCCIHPRYIFKQWGSSTHWLHQSQISGRMGRGAFFQSKARCCIEPLSPLRSRRGDSMLVTSGRRNCWKNNK